MVSATLKKLRKANGFTQKQIADKLNIDRSTYSYYELGKINPSISSMVTLADLYGISLDEIVHYDEAASTSLTAASPAAGYESVPVLSEDEKKLIASYRKLSTAAKEDVLISVINIARDSEQL
ncbi:MAG: helix-turn-helix transcriptional regulator [Clostridia bacterium]|nr:helix-turn-helix transcriptional regulator [Clostridia bacterium]